jgi:hypothetical protein
MRLTLYNGSPRGKNSNTAVLLEPFLRGFMTAGANGYSLIYLGHYETTETQLRFFHEADYVIIAFPLYTGCMPAMVKGFFEALELIPMQPKRPQLGFLIQSGLPEAVHFRALERYLEKTAKRFGCKYLGSVIKGGVEGMQANPARLSRKLRHLFYLLGKHFGRTGQFDPELVLALSQPAMLSPFWGKTLSLLSRTGLTNFYWDRQLKENNALDKRFFRPFKP